MELQSYYSLIIGGGLFLGMIAMIEAGRRIGLRQKTDDGAGGRAGLVAIDAAVFSLLGLLIAFSFSGAADRFDVRRQLSIQEANEIETAWSYLDILPAGAQSDLRELFRQYLDARLRVARVMPDWEAAQQELRRCGELQNAIWTRSVSVCTESTLLTPTMLLLPALNQMFDLATARTANAQIHLPLIIFLMLFLLALASGLLVGHGISDARERSWMHIFGFAAAVAIAVSVIVDIEYPRAGFIRMDAMDQMFMDLRQTMDHPR